MMDSIDGSIDSGNSITNILFTLEGAYVEGRGQQRWLLLFQDPLSQLSTPFKLELELFVLTSALLFQPSTVHFLLVIAYVLNSRPLVRGQFV